MGIASRTGTSIVALLASMPLAGCSVTTCSVTDPEASHIAVHVGPALRHGLATLLARLCVEDSCSEETLVSTAQGSGESGFADGVYASGASIHVLAGAFGSGTEAFRARTTYTLTLTALSDDGTELASTEDSFEFEETEPNGEGCDPTVLTHETTLAF